MINTKEARIQKFNDLLELNNFLVECKDISYDKAKNYSILDKPLHHNHLKYDLSSINIEEKDVIELMTELDSCGVLIFASAKNPGGGVLNGSIAQEEAISYHSTWYFQAKENTQFYSNKGASALNKDDISIANGFLLTDINHQEIKPKPISFIGCAAPNLAGIKSQGLNISEKIIYEHLNLRIQNILLAAESMNVKNLILGAFGCGVFGLDPVIVAHSFKHHIENNHFTGNIHFAINNSELASIFRNTIHNSPSNINKIKL